MQKGRVSKSQLIDRGYPSCTKILMLINVENVKHIKEYFTMYGGLAKNKTKQKWIQINMKMQRILNIYIQMKSDFYIYI